MGIFFAPGMFLRIISVFWYLGIRNTPGELGLNSLNINITNKDSGEATFKKHSMKNIIFDKKLYLIVFACMSQRIIKDGITL